MNNIRRRAFLGVTTAALVAISPAAKAFIFPGGGVNNTPPPVGFSVPLTLNNIHSSSNFAAPTVSYVHSFADGDIPVGGSPKVVDSTGATVTNIQFDHVVLWPSGCMRTAVVSHSCTETINAGTKKTYTFSGQATPVNNTPAGGWGGINNIAAVIAAASNFKVVYGTGNATTGIDAGANTYTVALNTIFSRYTRATSPGAFGITQPKGGWEFTKIGPALVEVHGWEYIRNDSTGNCHGYVRCDMWLKCWGTPGNMELRVRTSMPRMWNAVDSSSEQFNVIQKRFMTPVQVLNGATLLKQAGGAGDTDAVTLTSTNFNTTTNRYNAAAFTILPQTPWTISSTGTIPSGMTANTPYWFAYTGGNCYVATSSAACSDLERNGVATNAWAQNTAYIAGFHKIVANGYTYLCVASGTSAATGTGPTGQGFSISDGTGTLRWACQTVAFGTQGSGTITATPVYDCYPSCGWNIADSDGYNLWIGTGTRPMISPGWDFTYLTMTSHMTLPYNPNVGFVTTNRTQVKYLPSQQVGGIQWDISTTGDSPGDQRIGYFSNWNVAAIYNPLDPFYVKGSIQGGLAWDRYPYSFMHDDLSGNHFMGNNGTNNSGVAYPNSPALLPGWADGDRAGNVSAGVVARGAQWSGWSSAQPDQNGYNGQYYATIQAAHLPFPSQFAYMLTGDTCFLDQILSVANTQCFMGYGTKQVLAGTTYHCLINGFYQSIQMRGWAWAWRCLVQAMAFCPNTNIMFPYIRDLYNDNIAYQANRIATFSANQQTFGLLNCLDPGNNPPGTLDLWMEYFLFSVVMNEILRGTVTDATAKANFITLGSYMKKIFSIFDPALTSVDAINYIGSYVMAYGPTQGRFDLAYTDPNSWFSTAYNQIAQFTGTLVGGTLTVTSMISGTIQQYGLVSGPNGMGPVTGSQITALGTGSGGTGTYGITPGGQPSYGPTTMYESAPYTSYIVGPPYIPYLYDQNGPHYQTVQNYPGNTTCYSMFGMGALYMTSLAFPSDTLAPSLLSIVKNKFSVITGQPTSKGGVQFVGAQGGFNDNFQTWSYVGT